MRVGPSRLISTAESSGESNDTAAAEWMTMSHDGEHGAVGLGRGRARRVPTSPAIVVIRRAVHSSNAGAVLGAQAVEGVVLQQLALHPPGRRRALAVADEQHELAVGHARSSRSTSAVPTNPVDPVMAMRLPASDSAITAPCLARLYHLVENGPRSVRRRAACTPPRSPGMDPRGRIAVVTGAAGGIGGALVRALVAAGAETVVATDLDADGIAAGDRVVARRARRRRRGGDDRPRRGDHRRARPDRPVVRQRRLAGGGGADAPDETWALQWRVNVMSHVYAARALLPGWIARGEGHLVTTASMAGILTSLGDGVYAATKHAAVGFAEWLAITHGDQGVKVSCICPGAVDTAMLRGGAGGDAAKATAVIGGGEVLAARRGRRPRRRRGHRGPLPHLHPPGDAAVRRAQGGRPRALDPRHDPRCGAAPSSSSPDSTSIVASAAASRRATASSTRRSTCSAPAGSMPCRSTRSPPRSASASRPSCTGSPARTSSSTPCSRRPPPRLAVVIDAAVRAAPDDPLERIDAVVRAVFRPGRAPAGAARSGPRARAASRRRRPSGCAPTSTRSSSGRSRFLGAEMDAGRLRRGDPRLVAALAYGTVTGIATEPEALRGVGWTPTPAGLRRLRAELRAFLRAARLDLAASRPTVTPSVLGVAAAAGVALDGQLDEAVDQLGVATCRLPATASGTSRSA